jgi:aspartate carbamoyltransferase catalytic subunit
MADSGASIILQQVENGVAVRMAVLYLSGRWHRTVTGIS